jgi:hypothetical protein
VQLTADIVPRDGRAQLVQHPGLQQKPALDPLERIPQPARQDSSHTRIEEVELRPQSSAMSNGMTGWMFRMRRVSSFGPTGRAQLNWNGTLTRLARGLLSCLAGSA